MSAKVSDLESLTSPENDDREMYGENILRTGRQLPDALDVSEQGRGNFGIGAEGDGLDILERQVLARKGASSEVISKLVCDEVRVPWILTAHISLSPKVKKIWRC
jgi:hypothetical protein